MKEHIEVTQTVPYKLGKSEHQIGIKVESGNTLYGRCITISNYVSLMTHWVCIPTKAWPAVKDAVDKAVIRLEQLERS